MHQFVGKYAPTGRRAHAGIASEDNVRSDGVRVSANRPGSGRCDGIRMDPHLAEVVLEVPLQRDTDRIT